MSLEIDWKPRSVSLEQLTELCDEMAALVRAGVPLERSLAEVAEELPGRLGQLTSSLASQLERGENLYESLGDSGNFPEFFPAMLQAGVESGRLGIALEGMAATGRRMIEMRRIVILAFMYPIIVFFVAYALFTLLISRISMGIGRFYDNMNLPRNRMTEFVESFSGLPRSWILAVPLLIILLVLLWLVATKRSRLLQSGGLGWALGWLLPARRVIMLNRYGYFGEILALLIEQRIPAPQALRLASKATGDRNLYHSSAEFAAALERGEVASYVSGMPPLLRWLIHGAAVAGIPSQEVLVRGLRRLAENYRDQARRQADFMGIYVPAIATILIGGGVTIFYAAVVFVPLGDLLYRMCQLPFVTQ